jgi:hypothetical protein
MKLCWHPAMQYWLVLFSVFFVFDPDLFPPICHRVTIIYINAINL